MFKHTSLVSILLVTALGTGCALMKRGPDPDKFSGYLKDYSQLEPTTDPSGETFLRWVNPKFTPANYKAVLVDPVTLYPAPEASGQVPDQTLSDVTSYMTQTVKANFGRSTQLATAPGPGVARVSAALTAADPEKRGLKAYQLLPAALVITLGKRAVSGTPVDATLFVEYQVTDSVSGELLLAGVREGMVKDLPKVETGDRPVTVDALKPLIDRWAANASALAQNHLAPR